MKNFTYYRPATAEAAVALLDSNWGATELLAGGTDLHDLQKEYVAQPDKVISLNGIGSDQINIGAIAVTLGAGVKLAAIAENERLRQLFPALTEAAAVIGGPQIRNMGTLGGNLCQRNRCWFFRDEHVHCLLKGGDSCYALNGDNRYHSVFTKGRRCVMVSPSTLAPPLIALGASATVLGPKGKRVIKLKDFFNAPIGPTEREHVLAPNELVLSVDIPRTETVKNANYEVLHKQSHDWPLVQAAVAFQLDAGGKAKDVQVVLGHVAPVPIVSADGAKAIEGKAVTLETATAAGEAATKGTEPLDQNAYKVKLIVVAVKRALLAAAGLERYWEA